jgi:hypothetical protein
MLDWTAYALATSSDPEFFWTNVAIRGEVRSPDDPLERGRVPPERFSSVFANELVRNDAAADVAVAASGAVIRSDEPSEAVRRVVDGVPGR